MIENSLSSPPIARVEQTETTVHGVTLTDDYAWLRQKENPEVSAYLEAENAYAEAVTAPQEALRGELYKEMLSHIQQTDVSVPHRDGAWWYYTRTEEGLQYAIHCRKRNGKSGLDKNAPEEVILDGNLLSKGHAFFAIGATDISDDGRWLAWTADTTGFRQYTLRIRDLETGHDLPGEVLRAGSVVWAADNMTLFYTVEDQEQKRQHQLWRHLRGTPYAADALVYQDDDERFNVGAGRTRDGKFLVLESHSHTTSECHVLEADDSDGKFRLIAPREDEHEYFVEHRNEQWFIRTNDKGRNYRLVTAPVDAPQRENWVEQIPHRADTMLEDVDLFRDFFIACDRENGLSRLRVYKFAGKEPKAAPASEISFPEPAYSAYPHVNCIFDTKAFRYSYQSLVSPSSVYEYDLATGASQLLKQVEVPGGFDRTLYASERIHATAEDGVQVPISIVYRKDKRKAGSNPLYVYGYGSYGYALPLGFNSNRLSLLDRGLVMAYAHIRGGGDLGETWHDAGKMLVKRNTFTDFIACVDHLTAEGYGDRSRVAIEGGSAGGLLMGAVTNMQPEKFRAVLSHVPFVDVMNTMLDASLPLTVPEYEEWGNPDEETYFQYMLSYSPYDNLKAASYPAILVKTSLHDSQVMYWEPAKYVAKLRTFKQDPNPLLLVTNMKAGHGGASGRYDYLEEIAFDYAFLLGQLGLA
ncbi:S9 family peptidase [Terracidiphilus gabretensis]|uniref:S9 family peptidase n=1 Tax=Terracidiphilus gabretensis TaxID=1577687 RepID=UPI00071BA7AE|nr:S9 family peptidase [Terracidiphilus gabretensis]